MYIFRESYGKAWKPIETTIIYRNKSKCFLMIGSQERGPNLFELMLVFHSDSLLYFLVLLFRLT